MPIYQVHSDKLHKIEETSFKEAGLQEKRDLQRLLRNQIEVIDPNVLIIAEEFDYFEDSKRRIDLLGIDKDANLVVIELKRTEDGGHMELQALRYAAMVSTITFDKAVSTFAQYLRASDETPRDAESELLDFLEWDEPVADQFAQDVRIILASAEFSKEITSTVLWLNDYGIDIRCVRMKPYRDQDRTLIDVEQVIPLPESSDYQIKVSAKNREERIARNSTKDFTKYDVSIYGILESNLAKRNAIFHIVSNLCKKGVKPEKIASLIHWRTGSLFLEVPGIYNGQEFIAKAIAARTSNGKNFAERRWFCDANELIYSDNKTFAFSNQWGHRWQEAVDILKENFPEAGIQYYPSKSE
jgi:hypothetical protein